MHVMISIKISQCYGGIWTIKSFILLMHGATMTIRQRIVKQRNVKHIKVQLYHLLKTDLFKLKQFTIIERRLSLTLLLRS
jgi:hypothetical protein